MNELFTIFTDPLEALGLRYFVTGSVACTIYGEPRLTHDIDLVLGIGAPDARRLVQAFGEDEFYCPPEEAIVLESHRDRGGHFNIIHHATQFKADIYLMGGHPLHAWALAHRKRIEVDADHTLWVAPPEYVILRKLEFYREGGSDKHLRDIRGMLSAGTTLDAPFLKDQLAALDLSSIWEEVEADT